MSKQIDNIVQYLNQSAETYQRVVENDLQSKLIALREWQCKRLLATHHQTLEVKKYRPAIEFFVAELYGPKDFSQRDQDIAKVVPKMEKWLPEEALDSLEVAIHLNALSQELDVAMLDKLGDKPLNQENYAEAYRQCDNKAQRELQINYIEQLGLDLAKVVGIPGIGMILKMARTPAKLAGVETLQQFLEDGFSAFKRLGNVEDFILPVVELERTIMQGILDSENVLPEFN